MKNLSVVGFGHFVVFLVLTTVCSSCKNEQESQRNKINFKASTDSIENSIKTINSVMDKLESSGAVNYFFDIDDNFYVNSTQLGKIDTIDYDNLNVLNKLTSEEKKKFISNVLFLKGNHLSSSFKDKPSTCYLYSYREVDDKSFNMNRDIFLKAEDKNYETLFAKRKVLDVKKNLVLIGKD